jgi:hypothetical protein
MTKIKRKAILMCLWFVVLGGVLWIQPFDNHSKVNVFTNLVQMNTHETDDVERRSQLENLIQKMYEVGCKSVFIEVMEKEGEETLTSYIGDPRHVIKGTNFNRYNFDVPPSKMQLFCVIDSNSDYSKSNAENMVYGMGFSYDYVDDLQGINWTFRFFLMCFITCGGHFYLRHGKRYKQFIDRDVRGLSSLALNLMIFSAWLFLFWKIIGFVKLYEVLGVFMNDDLFFLLKKWIYKSSQQIGLGIWNFTQVTMVYIAVNSVFLWRYVRD